MSNATLHGVQKALVHGLVLLSFSFPAESLQDLLLESFTIVYNDVQTCPIMKDLSDRFVKCYQARTCHDLLGVILGEGKEIAWQWYGIDWNCRSHVGMSNIHELFVLNLLVQCRYLKETWPCASKTVPTKD